MTELFPPTGAQNLVYWYSLKPRPACFVYVFQAGRWGPIKIGRAKNVVSRMATLQTGNPEPLRLLYALPGDRPLERRLHRHASEARMKGEWFDPEKADPTLEYVSVLSDEMVVRHKEGREDYADDSHYDQDGRYELPEKRRRFVDWADEPRGPNHAAKARQNRKYRDKGEFAAAHAAPTFSPHRPS